MGMYRKEWDCCGSVTETDAWEPETCPFCPSSATAEAQAADVGGNLLHIGVAVGNDGATISLIQSKGDGCHTVVYSETHPIGDSAGTVILASRPVPQASDVRHVLQEMVDMMDSGDEGGRGSKWYERAVAALAAKSEQPTDEEKSAFLAHLKRASEEVATWPAWKRGMWGQQSEQPQAGASELPPLPDHMLRWTAIFGAEGDPYYTARQMTNYGQACYAIGRAAGTDAKDAQRYEYLINCDYLATKKYLPNLEEAEYKRVLRIKHDAAIASHATEQGGAK